MVRISTEMGLLYNKFAAEQTEFRVAAGRRRVTETGDGWHVLRLLPHDESMGSNTTAAVS